MARPSRFDVASGSAAEPSQVAPGAVAFDPELAGLVDEAQHDNRRALARLLTLAERGALPATTDMARGSRRPYVVGITGAPGAGKSTLVSGIVAEMRNRGSRVALLLIDPSSPVSGGAVLGDRVRLAELSLDQGVFCRSVATRGHLGGLTATTDAIVDLFGIAGWPMVVVETVGVGQAEVDIMGLADTTIVVLSPGMGDSIQAAKAGLMEIGDLYVLNKCDLPGSGQLRRDVEGALALSGRGDRDVIATSATDGDGVADVVDVVVKRSNIVADRVHLDIETIDHALRKELDGRWSRLMQSPEMAERVDIARRSIERGELTVTAAADALFSFNPAQGCS